MKEYVCPLLHRPDAAHRGFGPPCRALFRGLRLCARGAAALLLISCLAWAFPVHAADAAPAAPASLSMDAAPAAPASPPADAAPAAPEVPPVSSAEIAEGLAFCAEFPVSLTLDGIPVESDVPPLIVRGRTLIPARALFERMGASVSWDEAARRVAVSTTAAGISLTIDSFEYAINGNIFGMELPPLIVGERTMIPVRVAAEALGCRVSWDDPSRTVAIVSAPPASDADPAREGGSVVPGEPSRGDATARADVAGGLPQLDPAFAGFSVVIDAGHGGSDPGALGEENGEVLLSEKEVNLDVALRLEALLRAAGFSVHMIRSDDSTVDRYERPEIANAQGAQLYISIHNNASEKPDVSGTSTYYYNKEWAVAYPLDSETLATSVQKSVSAHTGLPDLGIHDGPAYIVLNRTQMPAIIVEGAFLTNASDRALMLTDAYREAYAFGVAVGLINALNGRAPASGGLDDMMPVGL